MEHSVPKAVMSGRVPAGRLLRVGALIAAMSASVNALVLAISSSLFGPVIIPPEETITLGQVVGASVGGAIGATVVFAVIGRLTRRLISIFCGIAATGLLLSFIPIVLAGATGSSAGTLALMHVVAAAIDVGMLTTLDHKRRAS